MAKRMTDTDKWKKTFMKSLPAEYKLFWLFILDECDHAGVWHTEMEVAESRLGIKLSLEKIRGFFKEKIVEFDSGNKMFVPDFVTFQYGILNPANKVHASVINVLSKNNLMGYGSPLQGAKATDKAKDKEKDKDKDRQESFEELRDPVFEMFRRSAAKHIPDDILHEEVGKFRNKYPHLHLNQSGPVINAWVSRIGEEHNGKPIRKSKWVKDENRDEF